MPKGTRTALDLELTHILGGPAATDLLGSVIVSDRRRAGRTPPAPARHDTMTRHAVSGPYDKEASGQPDHEADDQLCGRASPVAGRRAGTAAELPGAAAPRRADDRRHERGTRGLLTGRVAEAGRMAASPTTTVTLRIPRELNDWLDEYIHRAWPQKVRKQDLVSEGLRLAFARRGRPGEPLLPTPFLPEEAP